MAEHIELILTICGFFVVSCVGLVVYIWKSTTSKLKDLEIDYKGLKKKVDQIEIDMLKGFGTLTTNYVKRFDDIKKTMNDNQIETIKSIDSLRLAIEKQTQFCKLVQEEKKN